MKPPPDAYWMAQALALARRGEGLTRPNPPVGAVVVRNGRAVGAGFHRRAGGPHAEIYALRAAGARARGATLYITLEPCSTWGRTPPCTEAILAAGVRRVVVALADPNPAHAGGGLTLLRRRGVEVVTGVGAVEAAALLEPFATWMATGRPRITLKLAMSLDGRIADRQGRSRWLTGPAARRRVQAWRQRVDAVMVGGGTLRADDPSLLPRPARGRQPWRIVVSGSGAVPATAQVFTDEAATRTLLVTQHSQAAKWQRRLAAKGVQVVGLPGRGAHLSMSALARQLGRLGLLHVLCEGGGELAAALIRAGLVDEYLFFVAPCLLGGGGRAVVGGAGWLLAHAPRLEVVETEALGPDLLIRARPRR